MSRLLYLTELPRLEAARLVQPFRAPLRNRTVDLLLTMETLCRLSYVGQMPISAAAVREKRYLRVAALVVGTGFEPVKT